MATVAGVLPSPDASVDFLYLFDRGYSTCIFDGVQIPAARLPFVRENYQCFSVSCLREGGERDGQPCPVLYENEPNPNPLTLTLTPNPNLNPSPNFNPTPHPSPDPKVRTLRCSTPLQP